MLSNDELFKRRIQLSPAKQQLLAQRLRGQPADNTGARIISGRARGEAIPLSFAQERLWFLSQLDPTSAAYNLFVALAVEGSLDLAVLTRSVNEIVRRHEILRTSFVAVDGRPFQVITSEITSNLSILDLRDRPTTEQEATTQQLIEKTAREPFDLSKGPLMRTVVVLLSAMRAMLLLTMHHIIADQWSREIMIQELTTLYKALSAGKPSPLSALPIQYADFAIWQRQWLQGVVMQQQLANWQAHLAGAPTQLLLPTDHPRGPTHTFRGAMRQHLLPTSLLGGLMNTSCQESATLFMVLLAGFQALLAYYSGQDDIVVGAPISNRRHAETEELIGFFVNTVALRTRLTGNPSLRELLRRVRITTLQAYEHQDIPFEQLVAALQLPRRTGYSPLFQVWFVFGDDLLELIDLPGLSFQSPTYQDGIVRDDLDLHISIQKGANGLSIDLTYNAALFDSTTMTNWLETYEMILQQLVAQPDIDLGSLFRMLKSEERKRQTMKETNLKKLNMQKFQKRMPSTLQLSPNRLVKTEYLAPGDALPLVVRPTNDLLDPIDWATRNRDWLSTLLAQHSAILFRNFAVNTIAEFEQFAKVIAPDLLEYHERSTPRHEVSGKVYTSTNYPADQFIPLHNEHSYSHVWPLKIWFYCVKPAEQGGATPIADSQQVFEHIDQQIRARFAQKHVMYTRNYGGGLDLPWQEAFQTDDTVAVEDYCRTARIECEWLPDGRLRTRQVQPAIVNHPQSGAPLWFNQAHLFHVSSLKPEVRASLLAMVPEADLPRNAYYGDGMPIEAEVLDAIRLAYQRATVTFAWQATDILLLDNMRVAHGREPFSGARQVVVAMAEPFSMTMQD
jgi:alpha-ketoglutarate-dependent taurine dioxygenase